MSKSQLARLSSQVPEVARLIAERDELLAALKNCNVALRWAMAAMPADDPLLHKMGLTEEAASALIAKHSKDSNHG